MLEPFNEVAVIMFGNKLYIMRGFGYEEYSEIKRLANRLDPIHVSIELVKDR